MFAVSKSIAAKSVISRGYVIEGCHLPDVAGDFVPQALRGEDLDLRSVPQDFLPEVECRREKILEHGIVFVRFHPPLSRMEGKGIEIIHLRGA